MQATMTTIRTAGPDEAEAVMDTLMLAFAADPVFRYWWPRASDYLTTARAFAHARGRPAFANGTVTIAGDFDAAAIWLAPGVEPDSPLSSDDDDDDSAAGAIAAELGRRIAAWHPEAPHWYLWMIGVEPGRQGRGFGSALLAHTLRQVDEEGAVAYLESSDPKNVPLYERHGFEVLDIIRAADVPPITPMLRRARG